MNFVDKQNCIGAFLNFFNHAFESSLKVAAEFRSSQQASQIERVNDPTLEWFGDVLRESDTTRILIVVKGIVTGKSGLIPVPNPQQTKITSLIRMGGSEEMYVSAGNPANINVVLDKPSTGVVQVTLQNLNATHPPGQYLGFIYEDQRLISEVVAFR